MLKNVSTTLTDSQCTGCGLCTQICPVDAITLKNNKYETPVRSVDEEKCISCGKCERMCPQIIQLKLRKPLKCYAAYPQSKYRDSRFSSGGAASLLAKRFMEETGGAVCGCTWDSKEKKAKHIVVDKIDDLCAFYGSKYVQSDIEHALRDINNLVQQRKKVLFIGTPCQSAAVQRKCNSDNLFTIDLICHGTPPMTYFQQYLCGLPHANEIEDVRFRGRHDFWLTTYGHSDDELYCEYKDCDSYFSAFLKGTIYRDNCYSCMYARIERVSDITVGDFWELERSGIEYNGNISLILTNSERGGQLFRNIGDSMWIQERSIEEAIKGNLQLSAPMEITKEQKEFRCLMEKEQSFMAAFQKTTGYMNVTAYKKNWHRMMFKHKIKTWVKRLCHI